MVRLAEALGIRAMTLRMWIKRGRVDGAFKEHVWPNGRARWMFTPKAAADLARQFGNSIDVKAITETDVNYPPERQQSR